MMSFINPSLRTAMIRCVKLTSLLRERLPSSPYSSFLRLAPMTSKTLLRTGYVIEATHKAKIVSLICCKTVCTFSNSKFCLKRVRAAPLSKEFRLINMQYKPGEHNSVLKVVHSMKY